MSFSYFFRFFENSRQPGKVHEISASSPSVKISFFVLTPQKLRFSFFVFNFKNVLISTTICVAVCTFNRCLSCSLNQFIFMLNLFAEQDKHLSKVNTMTQIVVQDRLLLMKKKAKSSSDHIT